MLPILIGEKLRGRSCHEFIGENMIKRNFVRTGFSLLIAIAIAACCDGSKTMAADANGDSQIRKPDAAGASGNTKNPAVNSGVANGGQMDGGIKAKSANRSLATDGAAGKCVDALPLKCGDRFDHSTLIQGRKNVWSGYSRTQRLESGRETIYVLEAAAGCSQAVARLKNLTVDLDLLLLTSCSPMSNTAAASTPLDLQTIETITFVLETGRQYYFVVDGYAGAEGTYTLEVDCMCK
jgi:hypothetical protein